ncbi:SCP2 sterol-binding domain-containing protein [Halomonas denitrificans]|nr:SCP2 sterol-binding domain-containing protein [Halomonas denitrificans]
MSRYVTPLPALLARACELVANRAAALDPAAAEHLAPLAGHWLRFELDGLGIDLWVGAEGERLRVLAEPEDPDLEADTMVSGTPGALLAMAVPDLSGPGGVRIEGDARLAQKFQQAMTRIDPDLEQGLADAFGPLLGPQMYRVVRETVDFGGHAARSGGHQFAHWLREESDLVPPPADWRAFRDGVDELREAVDRFAGRVRRRLDA